MTSGEPTFPFSMYRRHPLRRNWCRMRPLRGSRYELTNGSLISAISMPLFGGHSDRVRFVDHGDDCAVGSKLVGDDRDVRFRRLASNGRQCWFALARLFDWLRCLPTNLSPQLQLSVPELMH